MNKYSLLVALVLSAGAARGEMFFLGENQYTHGGIDPYYSVGVEYLGNGTFVGVGEGTRQNPRDAADQRMFYKNGEELDLSNSDMVYLEFPEQCLPEGHEEEKVFVYYDILNNLDLDVVEVTVPATGGSETYFTQNLQLPAHPSVTLDSFIPRFPKDAEWKEHLSYRELSEESKEELLGDGHEPPENKLNLESTVRHYDVSELNPEQTMYTPSAFLDYDQTMLYAMGGFSSSVGKTREGGVVVWASEYIGGMTILQPYSWWIQAMKERRTFPAELALEILQDPSKDQLECDPGNYRVNGVSSILGAGGDTSSPGSGGGSFCVDFILFIGLLKLIFLLAERNAMGFGLNRASNTEIGIKCSKI